MSPRLASLFCLSLLAWGAVSIAYATDETRLVRPGDKIEDLEFKTESTTVGDRHTLTLKEHGGTNPGKPFTIRKSRLIHYDTNDSCVWRKVENDHKKFELVHCPVKKRPT